VGAEQPNNQNHGVSMLFQKEWVLNSQIIKTMGAKPPLHPWL